MFAGRFDETFERWSKEDDYDKPRGLGASATSTAENETGSPMLAVASGEEAYLRRLALSQGVVAPLNSLTGDDVYARRVALSQGVEQQSAAPTFIATSDPMLVPTHTNAPSPQPSLSTMATEAPMSIEPHVNMNLEDDVIPGAGASSLKSTVSRTTSGEDAFLRRAALSAQASRPNHIAVPPSFTSAAPPSPPELAYNPFAPPSVPPPPPLALLEEQIKAKREAAAAIAARLAGLAAGGSPAGTGAAGGAIPAPATGDDEPFGSKRFFFIIVLQDRR
jgi:splicing factor 45